MQDSPNFSYEQVVEQIWERTCGSWENMNQENLYDFLDQCNEQNLEPLFCLGWIEQHKDEISNWGSISSSALEWVNDHTSTGSPLPE